MKTETITLDVRGVLCPIPVIETKKIVDTHKGATIITIVDNEVSRDNVTKFGQSQGFAVTNTQEGKDYFITLTPANGENHTQTTAATTTGVTATIVTSTTTSGNGTSTVTANTVNTNANTVTIMTKGLNNRVLLMTKDYLGEGEKNLGRNLMKTFWLCLAESDGVPKKIYFINSSVNMVINDSVHLDNLKTLADRGVELAACGICLEYFNAKDQLAIGSITNMYAITESIVGEDIVKL